MPKKQPKNAFFFYMLHFKEQEAKRGRFIPGGLPEVSKIASESWNKMNAQQRGPFEKQAKEAKLGPKKEVEKYTSQGIPLSLIAKEQKKQENAKETMLRRIKEIVKNAFDNNAMGSEEFYFISGNYFLNVNEIYLPAELALIKYTFESGIVSKYHTYINPEKVPLGYLFEAKDYSEKTHRLPIPPSAKGERNYKAILNEIDNFMGNRSKLAPLFTLRDQIPIITSFISQFCGFCDVDPDRYPVYPLHQIFYDVKEEAVKNSINGNSFRSIHIAENLLNRDNFAYLPNTACNFHEDLDCVKFCALANVTKWSYIFSDHICVDLGIDPEHGKHFPVEIDLSHANQSDFSKLNDTVNTTNTFTAAANTQSETSTTGAAPNWARRLKTPDSSIADDSYAWANRPLGSRDTNHRDGNKEEEFPSLGSRRKVPSTKRDTNDDPWNSSTSSSSSNPWNQSDSDDGSRRSLGRGNRADMSNDSIIRGMGRGSSLYRSERSSEASSGRGRAYNDLKLEKGHDRKDKERSRPDHSLRRNRSRSPRRDRSKRSYRDSKDDRSDKRKQY